MNRRGFVTGFLAALAAPAVITTPGLLMPVSTLAFPTYGPGGVLTPEMIAGEFSRILQGTLTRTVIPGTENHKQSAATFEVGAADFKLSLEQFRERYLTVAAARTVDTIGDGALCIGRIMQLPNGIDVAAQVERNGVFARAVYAYDIWDDAMKMRLDVLHS